MAGFMDKGTQRKTDSERAARRKIDSERAAKRRTDVAALAKSNLPENKWKREGAEPAAQLGKATESQLMKNYYGQIGRAQAQLGSARSSGAGTAGRWGAMQTNIASKGAGNLAHAATASEQIEAQMKHDYMVSEDKNAFMAQWENTKANYRTAELNRQAELNDPSWWVQVWKINASLAAITIGAVTGNPLAISGGVAGLSQSIE